MQAKKYCISAEGTETNTVIPANGYAIVWCDKLPTQSQLHANFKLENTDGAYVILSAPDRSWADTLAYCAHDGRESVGRYPDGGSEFYRMYVPTIASSNHMNLYATRFEVPELPFVDGITDIAHSGEMSISCQGNFLHVRSEDCPDLTLTVYTLNGMEVMRQAVQADSGRAQVSILMLAPGTYVARVTASDGNQCRIKFVKR